MMASEGKPSSAGNPPEKQNPAGSPPPGEPAFLAVGRMRRPHGLKGEIQMDVQTDFPERLQPGVRVFAGEEHRRLRLGTVRSHGNALLISFKEFTTPEEVGVLRNQTLYVSTEDRPPLEEGEYYHHQIIGLKVLSEEGEEVGVITDILETGASDIFIVTPGLGPDVLIPANDQFVKEINVSAGWVRVFMMPGLRGES